MTDFVWGDLAATVPGNGNDRYSELTGAAHNPPAAPNFVFGPIPGPLNHFYYNECIVHPAGTYTLSRAGVTGDGFPVRDGVFLTAPAYFLTEHYIAATLQGVVPPMVRREAGRAVCISAPGYLIYGHWLVDILPKLFQLPRLGIDLADETLVMPANTPQFGQDWLELAGVRPGRVVTYDPKAEIVEFDELVLPLPLRANSRVSGALVDAIGELLARTGLDPQAPSPVPGGRIYVSRQRTGRNGRLLENAGELEQAAVAAGYTIVYPELLSLPEQIALFRQARFLMGEYGSALHGSMFAGPECVVCALRGTSTDPGFLQSGLCQVAGQRFGYVFGRTVDHPDGSQAFTIERSDLTFAMHMMDLIAAG